VNFIQAEEVAAIAAASQRFFQDIFVLEPFALGFVRLPVDQG
jgi:hypothetical protein